MPICTLIIKDETNIQLNGLDVETRRKLSNKLSFMDPYAYHTTQYKLGRWNGMINFFSIGGSGYLNHLDIILPIVEEAGYTIEVEDQRKPFDFAYKPIDAAFWSERGVVWPEKHPMAGQPIILREDQVEAVNIFLEHQQVSQQISTGAGKCLVGKTRINIVRNGFPLATTYQELAAYIEERKKIRLRDNEAVDVQDLLLEAYTPTGLKPILSFIKKTNLDVVTIKTDKLKEFTGSIKHIVQANGQCVFLEDLQKGDILDHLTEKHKVFKISKVKKADCFDISIPFPHLYYDAQGFTHHNTITTATMCKAVEHVTRTLTIVPSKSLVNQTAADYKNVGLDYGVYFGDKKEIDKHHTICTWQSLNCLDKKAKYTPDSLTLSEFLMGINCVIVDEAHSAKANVLKYILTHHLKNCCLRVGLTGTIPKEQFAANTVLVSLGPVKNYVFAHELQAQNILANIHINIVQIQDCMEFRNYRDEYSWLVTDLMRLEWLANFIKEVSASGNTLVLVNRIATGNTLLNLIPNATFIKGAVKEEKRKEDYDSFNECDDKIAIATFGVAAVGINIPRIHNLVLLEIGRSYILTTQAIGRALRKGVGKDFANIYDITSNCKYSKKHLTERKKFYNEAKYPYSTKKVYR